MFKLPKLFGYASNGSIKEWSIRVEKEEFIVSHGKMGGKLQEKRTTAKAKNVGRANETSPAKQAIKEAKAKWQKQVDKGYAAVLEDAGKLLNPMLAHDYRKQGHRIEFPAYAQPKLDGVRCLVYKDKTEGVVFMSRGGKKYPPIKRIVDVVTPLFEENPELILDGELYIHGESLQNIVSAVKKHKELTSKVEFWCFDVAIEGKPYKERRLIKKVLSSLKHRDGCLVFLIDVRAKDEDHLKELHDLWVNVGYEGIMVRNVDGDYKFNHRSPDLQKYKVFMDKEFPIIGHKVDKDGCVVWKVQVGEGIECDVTPTGTKESKQALALVAETYYGKLLKTKFQAYTDGGNLSFPVGVELDRTDHV